LRRGPRLSAQTAVAAGVAVLALMGLALGPGSAVTAEERAPRVVVSIQPLHSLVAAVMIGRGEPVLLVRGANSPHDYSLTPADARALSQADLVLWTGTGLEMALAQPIAALAENALVLAAVEAEGVEVLPGREAGPWAAHADDDHDHGAIDGHLWLDPRNAAAIARAAADALAAHDPAGAARYRANAATLGAALRDLEHELAATLAPVRGAPFIVFHDAYQYFERRFALNAAGAISFGPERAPGARRIGEIRDTLRSTGAVCVFTEPQFEPALARTVAEGAKARIAVLDPLGAALTPGPGAYPALLSNLAGALRDCLTAGS